MEAEQLATKEEANRLSVECCWTQLVCRRERERSASAAAAFPSLSICARATLSYLAQTQTLERANKLLLSRLKFNHVSEKRRTDLRLSSTAADVVVAGAGKDYDLPNFDHFFFPFTFLSLPLPATIPSCDNRATNYHLPLFLISTLLLFESSAS